MDNQPVPDAPAPVISPVILWGMIIILVVMFIGLSSTLLVRASMVYTLTLQCDIRYINADSDACRDFARDILRHHRDLYDSCDQSTRDAPSGQYDDRILICLAQHGFRP